MSNCNKYQELIIKLISSSLEKSEDEILNNHIAKCKDCAGFLRIHQNLKQSQQNIPQPDVDEFRIMRQNTLRKIRLSESSTMKSLWDKIQGLFVRIEFAYGVVALLLLFSIYNFFSPDFNDSKIPSDFINQIDYTAQQNQNLSDIENSPYTYSNLEIKKISDQQIHLGFNVSTYIELIRDKNDPLVGEILAQSIINSQQTGARLNTISYAKELIDPKLKETLIFVLINDPDFAVRLKALDILTQYANDSQIQEAFLAVLKNEESVQMRLIVMDFLTSNNVDTNLIAKELSTATTRINQPIIIKAQEYINHTKNN